jgi:hypothetical protein
LAYESRWFAQFICRIKERAVQVDIVANDHTARTHRSPSGVNLPSHIPITMIGVMDEHEPTREIV